MKTPTERVEELESPFLGELLFAGEGHGDLLTGPLLRESPFSAAPGVELQTAPGISGVDNRTEVQNTTIPPYRWVCSIAYEAEGQTLQGGTGLLISNRHVLTAGHVVRDKASAPAAHSVYVYPGRHYGGEPFGRIPAARVRVSTRFDFGLITLERAVDSGVQWWGHPSTRTTWWNEKLIPLRELFDPGIPVATAGYPGAKDAQRRRMYEVSGFTVPRAFAGSFRHTLDTTEGQSGSPIWTVRGGLHILIGVVTSYDPTRGQNATFVKMVRDEIDRWMADDAPRVERRIALEVPYRWICRLEVYDNDLRREIGYGTGLLISDRHVLTSAGVIYDFSKDRRRYSVRITPGYEFGKEAFGSTTASQARVSPKFSPETRDGSADYGLLTLSRSLGSATYKSIGNAALGFWGREVPSYGLSTSAADWSGKAAHIAAFSRESGGGGGYHKLRVSSGRFVGLYRGQILHNASSKLDAPGAPVWVEGGGRKLLAGVASSIFSKDSGVNWGCYLSQETRSHLMRWINEDYEQSELEAGDQFRDEELESLLASPDGEAEGQTAETNTRDELLEPSSSARGLHDADVDRLTQPTADNLSTAEGHEDYR